MTPAAFSPVLPLSDGNVIPQLGLGVYKVEDTVASTLVAGAIEAGYRHIDTAALYNNERGVGEGVRASGVPREEIFVTTKVWNDRHGYDETQRAFDESLELLGMDYVDLYLIHWPAPEQNRYTEAWRALVKLQEDGRVRSIGVSNFKSHHLNRLRDTSDVLPVLNQVELHPWLPQLETRTFDRSLGILTESWSPLARGRVLGNDILDSIADKHGKSPAQVVLRWHIQLGLVVIPKSNSLDRIRENSQVFDFTLDVADVAAIAGLETGERTGLDPDDHG
ncbi:2,5-diketo-D-gluconate reductase A [Glaciihabitans tibetensis]|uniref:2,5-diketo-D-gluconate reductase A n=1 Tax=Glaciihabitans tibetensis TaxID=1266600 RepID=A0A2T0VAN3_9MICO|nr:aldo/keto reductase [Glaciihabitans tibetensis]PRY67259.1 2,5-diketo-D-gluconate reductase A [Glaciihabitans tibetensis]